MNVFLCFWDLVECGCGDVADLFDRSVENGSTRSLLHSPSLLFFSLFFETFSKLFWLNQTVIIYKTIFFEHLIHHWFKPKALIIEKINKNSRSKTELIDLWSISRSSSDVHFVTFSSLQQQLTLTSSQKPLFKYLKVDQKCR